MQLFKGSYVNLAAGSRQLWPYSNDNAGGLAIVVKLSQLSEKRMFMFRTTSEPWAFPCDIPAVGRSLFTKYWVREFEYVLQITQLATKPKVRFLRT